MNNPMTHTEREMKQREIIVRLHGRKFRVLNMHLPPAPQSYVVKISNQQWNLGGGGGGTYSNQLVREDQATLVIEEVPPTYDDHGCFQLISPAELDDMITDVERAAYIQAYADAAEELTS